MINLRTPERMDVYFENIDYHIEQQIRFARKRILVAVAWFTNEKLCNALIKKNKIDIEIIVDDNSINRQSYIIKELIENNIEVSYIKDLEKIYYIMHNKFCIIDNKTVITGSYNWTRNANSNDENIIISEDQRSAAFYAHEFRRIKDLGQSTNGDQYLVSEEFFNETINLVYSSFKTIIKSNISDLQKGLLVNWVDEKVKNTLRRKGETTRNNLRKIIEKFRINSVLVSKYGVGNLTLATNDEKIRIKDRINKSDFDEIENELNRELKLYKLRAIKKLQSNYLELLKSNEHNLDNSKRIMKVLIFLGGERIEIYRTKFTNI